MPRSKHAHGATSHSGASIWDPCGQKFLRGPVQLAWLAEAQQLGFSAITVGLECWFLAGVNGAMEFRLNLSRLRVAPRMARSSARRGLAKLEAAGLVSVARPVGQRVIVAIRVVGEDAGTPLVDEEAADDE